MAGPEARIRKKVREVLTKFGWAVTPVDNEACWRGTADVSYVGTHQPAPGPCFVDKVEGWIELKQLPSWPKRGGVVSLPEFEPQQRIWLRQRWAAGGDASLLLRVGNGRKAEWLLFTGPVAAEHVGKVGRVDLYERAHARSEGYLSGSWLASSLAYLRSP
jgi:hypothetical protein